TAFAYQLAEFWRRENFGFGSLREVFFLFLLCFYKILKDPYGRQAQGSVLSSWLSFGGGVFLFFTFSRI
ncbi:MAG TPA: hypothetical protein PKD96_04365, partial [Candidatus Absconditabacterales bacterium]|nr:hypothetical protein [Candidatus Absconditabacterales bacterium]